MDETEMKKFCGILNREFGEPFMPKGYIVAKVIKLPNGNPTMSINIGRRDIQIGESMEIVGTGTLI